MSYELNKEKLRGRYAIITAVIAAVGTVVGAVLGAKFGPVTVNVNLDDYVSQTQYETVSEQNDTLQSTVYSLQEENLSLENGNTELQEENLSLQEENAELQEENASLQSAYTAVLSELSEKETPEPDSAPNQISRETVKLTALPVLGNNQSSQNYIYNSPENDDRATSNLGEAFNSSISMRKNGNIDFYLNKAYQSLNAIICISEGTKDIDDYSSVLTIYSVAGNGDNETVTVLYTSPALTMGFIPDEIGPINVSEVEHLRISFYTDGYYGNVPRIILGNPELTPK